MWHKEKAREKQAWFPTRRLWMKFMAAKPACDCHMLPSFRLCSLTTKCLSLTDFIPSFYSPWSLPTSPSSLSWLFNPEKSSQLADPSRMACHVAKSSPFGNDRPCLWLFIRHLWLPSISLERAQWEVVSKKPETKGAADGESWNLAARTSATTRVRGWFLTPAPECLQPLRPDIASFLSCSNDCSCNVTSSLPSPPSFNEAWPALPLTHESVKEKWKQSSHRYAWGKAQFSLFTGNLTHLWLNCKAAHLQL